MKAFFNRWLYSLPIQLVFHHFKRNLPLIAVWFFFLAAVFGWIGPVYGIQYLFLDPEYLNKVGFWSFFLVGLSFANLTMAFFITSYILDSHKFSFVGLLEKPFPKFSLNNSIIPLIVFTIYVVSIIQFQWNNEFVKALDIILFLLGLVAGVNSFLILTFVYFRFTNKDIFRYLAGSVDKRLRKSKLSRDRMLRRWKESKDTKYGVTSYLDLKLRNHPCNHLHNFYDRDAILRVFDQNHFNSVIFDLLIIAVVLVLGLFMDNPIFQIPAAASVLLLFSIIVMMVGAITYWFKGWGIAFVVAMLFLANTLVVQGVIKKESRAAGMSYTSTVDYSLARLNQFNASEQFRSDKQQVAKVLKDWRDKFVQPQPKMIFLCTSGGGQRAAIWSFLAMQQADSFIQGGLMDHTFMISGASGGMVGAAYYRELYLRSLAHGSVNLASQKWLDNLGKDNLNAIIFSLVVNDTFLKVGTYEHEGETNKKDRGFMFEQNLNSNLDYVFNKNVEDYYEAEFTSQIPWLLLSPTIANDGRKLYISNLPVSFMNSDPVANPLENVKIRSVDFLRYFEGQKASKIPLLTALRMSASFPYITPTISLPSQPRLEIMDAGISDNFGISDALLFIQQFKDWISQNTGGVVLMVVRDTKRINEPERRANASLMDRFFLPIADVYNNLGNMQDINNDKQLNLVSQWLDCPFDVVEIAYDNETQKKARASLSWHLTSKEKETIINSIDLPANRSALLRLKHILDYQGEPVVVR